MLRLLIPLLLLAGSLQGQSLRFFPGEQAVAESHAEASFRVASEGGAVRMVFSAASSMVGGELSFDIYRLVSNKEQYHATVKAKVSNNKLAEKEVWFYEPGRYRVYVFDEQDRQLTKAEFTVRKGS
ncbi:MAG: hypothetical protein RMK52_05095 [Chitinophagales bacterium]|nr:hypothetical protein [Chitinophagales bacterium]MDW8393603.1 hypothetical protein [Chitinophagales bacterium]